MTNIDIADVLGHIAEILEINGENPFKIRAYSNASRTISLLSESVSAMSKKNDSINIPGIGKDLSLKIKELINTGHLAYYDELVKSIPSGVLELIKLRGLGPKKANILYKAFNIHDINDLYDVISSNKLQGMRGFGKKTIDNLKQSIAEYRVFKQRSLYALAQSAAVTFVDYLKNIPNVPVNKIMIVGSLRRKMETVGNIDIIVAVEKKHNQVFMESILNYDDIVRIDSTSETKISVVLRSGIRAVLRIVKDKNFVYALHYFTGSQLHNEKLRELKKQHGYVINEYGIFKDASENGANIHPTDKIKVTNEVEFYNALGMQFIPPELREGMGEIADAVNHDIPELIDNKDLRGIFHIHTAYTDGRDSLNEMVKTSFESGYEYVGISDHSVSAYYANGLGVTDLISQIKYINSLNDEYKGRIKIFKGIESDILTDGGLDYDNEMLSMLDFVIASVHSKFNMSESQMTERIISAIKNPYTTMIGHLTGRLLLERKGYEINVSRILDYASKYKTIIELNSNPKRLDIDWRYIKEAISKSVLISINPDSHNSQSTYFVNYGVNVARKGGATKANILNTRSASDVFRIFKDIRDYKLGLIGNTDDPK